MSTIEIKVTGRELSFINMPTISAGAVGADSIKFEFESPSVWDGYIKYCVVFKNRSQYCPEALDNSNIAQISSNMLSNEGILYIGLCGYKDATRLTSTIVSYEIKNGVYCIHSSEEEELAKTKFEQILEYYDATLREQQAINERLDEIEKAPFNVKLFGARGDGETDDSQAIQNALQKARESGGGTVYFPCGTYLIEGLGGSGLVVYENTTIYGETGTVLKAGPERSNILRNNVRNVSSNPETDGGYSQASNIKVINITFDCNGKDYPAKGSNPIAFGHCENIVFENCRFTNCVATTGNPHYMDLGGVKNILIDGCIFDEVKTKNASSDYIQLDCVIATSWGGSNDSWCYHDGTICRDVTIQNCKFYGNTDSTYVPTIAIGCCHNYKAQYMPHNVTIKNNEFHGTWTNAISGSNLFVNNRACIFAHAGAECYTITGNTWLDNKTYDESTTMAIFINNSHHSNVVKNNTFYNTKYPIPSTSAFNFLKYRSASGNTHIDVENNITINDVNYCNDFNVKDFGAKGNGIDDDADAIQSAINAARDAGGGTVFFPSGIYYFSHTVTFASNIKLQGDVNTVFTADKVSGTYTLRNATFLEIGTPGNTYGYAGFSNVEINNIIFDLGGQWSLNDDILTYKAKYKSGAGVKNNGFYTYCPIVACHGDGFRVINCTFKNGIYGGYTGNRGTNPHVMDIGGVKNILIEGCTFEPAFVTATAISNWTAELESYGDTGYANATASDIIQLDACYADGGQSDVKGKGDGTNCRDIVIRNNKFYGLPHYDWKKVVNNTGDNDSIIKGLVPPAKEPESGTSWPDDTDSTTWIRASFAAFRFMPVAAVGACHAFNDPAWQPQNVEIYDNYFEGRWSSHYSGINARVQIRWKNYSDDHSVEYTINGVNEKYYYPLQDGSPELLLVQGEPARKHCHGAIYVYPGAKGYHIHHNTFKETTSWDNNVSTAVFLYGSLAGTVHDNIFIEYGEPLPRGKKEESMSGFTFEAGDAWSSSKTGYYDGVAYCKSSNNIWIKDGDLSEELSYLRKVLDVDFSPIKNDYGVNVGHMLDFSKTNGTSGVSITTSQNGEDGSGVCLDVRMFGASGGGAVDDGWAIQSAIDRCRDMGGGTIYFPKGKYNITRTLFYYSNMTFKFEQGATIRTMLDESTRTPSIIFAPYFQTDIAYLNNGKGTYGFASNRYAVENVVFDGGTIDGFSYDPKTGNRVADKGFVLLTCLCKNIKFYNMTFKNNHGGHCIEINSSTDVIVRDCRFLNFVQGGGITKKNDDGSFTRGYDGGMYAENLQIDAATAGAIGSAYIIEEHTGKAPNGIEYDQWYTYQSGSMEYSSLGGYFNFTLLPPGNRYYWTEVVKGKTITHDDHQDVINKKLGLDTDTITATKGFHQCCHNIEIASCYFENNQDNDCFVSAIGCHTYFADATHSGERYADLNQDKHSGIKIHDNTFIWAVNHYHNDRTNTDTGKVLESVKNNPSYWRGVIAFGTNESVTGKAFKNVHVYNVSIHGNMFYRNSNCLIDETQPKIGYAITTIRDDTRYTRENVSVPQSKYKIYGNFYAGINGWENGTSSEIYQEGSTLVITDGISMPVKSGENLMFY